ncbi:trace amine-associated receptor 13c-like [Betta splendens]|uniref:Trace amine-associated receptor 13c-like n=1 Tax=Betta splendens TaxID=158456 RepID=A0A6P7LH85_BETSP|nr:trace amine-associated receptor 13c-like [Betta splendens]
MMEEEAVLCFPQLNTSCWKPKRPRSHSVLTYILLSCISLLTVTLNLLVIISISHFKQLHTSTNFLLLSLAVSDLLVGLIMLFEGMVIDGCWYLSDIMCTMYYVLQYIATCSSVGIMVLISVDRYVAICNPLHYSTKVSPRRVKILIPLCWICCMLFVSLQMKENLKQTGQFKSCVGECVIVFNMLEQVADLVLMFILPISVIVVLYVRVFAVALTQARAMRTLIMVASRQHSVGVTAKRGEVKAARTLGVVVAVFLLCVCPLYCVSLAGQDTLFDVSSASFVICLAYFNSCLNPLVYALFYPWFRKSVRLIVTLQILKPGSFESNILK